ncbi:hypothetical protein [Streptomyces violaceus]|uniref:Uncharacterized protein n=1 Tax=Streptomyces violaceus TaxID=1936 RepID=A0ABY9UMG9_STRVL|nr:hypothetical protein [Streptomyces janthinus]WND24099.1 hypothetical protein RI060_43040 [Streptomyces janthinus]GGS96191.1 hypothetical protein GCM10010270_80190 [Streptomyces janthinus]
MAVDIETVSGAGSLVEGDSEDFGVAGDGVADPPAVVVGQGGAVGGEHEPVVGILAEIPDRRPSRGSAALSMPWRHGQHDLDPLPCGDALERAVDEVEVTGLHLLAVGEHGCHGARGPVHGDLAFHGEQLRLELGGCLPGDL